MVDIKDAVDMKAVTTPQHRSRIPEHGIWYHFKLQSSEYMLRIAVPVQGLNLLHGDLVEFAAAHRLYRSAWRTRRQGIDTFDGKNSQLTFVEWLLQKIKTGASVVIIWMEELSPQCKIGNCESSHATIGCNCSWSAARQ